jgi:hypothetical protein
MCPKRLGDYDYYSYGDVPEGYGLVLCQPCAAKLERMPETDAIRLLMESAAARRESAEEKAAKRAVDRLIRAKESMKGLEI